MKKINWDIFFIWALMTLITFFMFGACCYSAGKFIEN